MQNLSPKNRLGPFVPSPALSAGGARLPQERETRSDELKAAAIIAVVCIHTGWPYANAFRFCVPVFVAIWAFHYEQGLSRRSPAQRWNYARKRFGRLLIPYASWTAIYLGLFYSPIQWRTTPLHTIVGAWFGGMGWSGQYFFVILFQLTWLLPVLRHRITPRSVWIGLLAGTLLNAVTDYVGFRHPVVAGIGDRFCIYWLPYVCLGVAFARGYPRSWPWLLPVAVVCLLVAPLEFTRLKIVNNLASTYLLPTVTLGSVALLLAVGPRFPSGAPMRPTSSEGWIGRAFRYIGRQSMVIFVGHLLFLTAAASLGFAPDDSPLGIMGRAGLIAAAIAASLALGWTLRRLRLGVLVGG